MSDRRPAAPGRAGLIDDPERALLALSPIRRRLLEALREPGSAASLAKRLDLPRQQLGYHLRALAKQQPSERPALLQIQP